jgi:hypothetical protein
MIAGELQQLDYALADAFALAFGEAVARRVARDEREYVRSEERRMNERERMMKREVRRAASNGSRADAEAAFEVTHSITPEELYSADLTNDDIAVAMRSAATMNESGRRAKSTLDFLTSMHHEIARGIGGPASSWPEQERARWQHDMDTARALTVAQHLKTPEQIEAESRRSIETDRRGSSDFMARVQAEAERMSGTSAAAPHREEIAQRARTEEARIREMQLREEGWR